ncbi:tetratricopeptide repeat protein [Lysobacter koreensis]|uniref:Tetratricopeptide repeat protein n=1 Tax=Lysobacter koreensis TaxID=266122 RepID=A0ABW2YRG0_9GAMM
MFKRLIESLTGKSIGSEAPAHEPAAPSVARAEQSELITAYDVHGREIQITRADWRDKMLLPQLQAKWNQPDELYGLIVNALNDDFVAEIGPASARLIATDPIVERSHVIRAIVLMKHGPLDEAERVLLDATTKVGETGTILTNLAKVYDARGDQAKTDATLWKAITLDPNQDNGLGWWLARERERSGDAGYIAALEKAAALPGSWRATLYLGRERLGAGDVPAALELFRKVLAQAAQNTDALLTVSGDLGNAGKIAELVDLTGPYYDAAVHGPQVGLNLLRAYLQLGRLDEGEALLDRLYALNMPPFKQHLDAMAGEFQDRRRQAARSRPVDESDLQIGQVPFELPIWMYGLRDPDWLFAPKPADARKVTFLMLGKVLSGVEHAEEQREDDLGRLSRAIPLYLAESIYEWTPAHAQSLVTVVMGGGPVVFGAQDAAGERETAAQLAAHTDVLVQGSIASADDAWTIDVGIWDTARLELIGRETVSTHHAGLEAAVLELEGKLLARLGGAQARPHDRLYTRPTLDQMQPYLNALAQSLMLGLVANAMIPKDAMWGERNMLEWPLRMALHWPDHEVPKAMYLSGISHAARYRSDVLGEFEERSFALLRDMTQTKSPVADLGPLLLHAFNRAEGLAAVRRETKDARRLSWIERVTATP